jgi:dipicolinate synthase subunit B
MNTAELKGLKLCFVVTGSFCTFARAFETARYLVSVGAELLPVMSYHAATIDTRFGKANDHIKTLAEICGRDVVTTIDGAEPIGPKNLADVLLIAPCTGNTIAKIANAVTDTPAVMAVKSHLRGDKPVVIALATNDAESGSARNIAQLKNTKNFTFVPAFPDDAEGKPHSLVADFDLIPATLISLLTTP